ncbi:hypothetical protein GCM10028809_55950 [Spirosoma gilvum]
MANNMVAGRRVAIDSAPVKANASMERLLEKQPNLPGPRLAQSIEDQHESVTSIATPSPREAASVITAADHQLRRLKKHQQNLKSAPTTLGAGNEKAKLLSNKTHYSPTDPDARIFIKLAAADRRVKPANSTTIVVWQWIPPKGLSATYRRISLMVETASAYLILP